MIYSFSIFGCKDNNQSDVSIEHLVIPCAESTLVLLDQGACYKLCADSLGRALLAFYWSPFVLQCQSCLLFQVCLDFLHLHSIPLWRKGSLFCFWMLVLDGFVSLHTTVPLQLLPCTRQETGLDYCTIEWFVLETKRDPSCYTSHDLSPSSLHQLWKDTHPHRKKKQKHKIKLQYTENNVVFLNSSYCCLLKGSEPNTFFKKQED